MSFCVVFVRFPSEAGRLLYLYPARLISSASVTERNVYIQSPIHVNIFLKCIVTTYVCIKESNVNPMSTISGSRLLANLPRMYVQAKFIRLRRKVSCKCVRADLGRENSYILQFAFFKFCKSSSSRPADRIVWAVYDDTNG